MESQVNSRNNTERKTYRRFRFSPMEIIIAFSLLSGLIVLVYFIFSSQNTSNTSQVDAIAGLKKILQVETTFLRGQLGKIEKQQNILQKRISRIESSLKDKDIDNKPESQEQTSKPNTSSVSNKEIQTVLEELRQQKKESVTLIKLISGVEEEISNLKKRLANSVDKKMISDIILRLESVESNLHSLSASIPQMETNLKTSVSALKDSISLTKEEMRKEIKASLKNSAIRLSSVSSRLQKIEDRVNGLSAEVKTLMEEKKVGGKEYPAVKVVAIKAAINSLRESIKLIQDRQERIERRFNSIDESIADIKPIIQKVSRIERSIEDLSYELAQQKNKIAAIEDKFKKVPRASYIKETGGKRMILYRVRRGDSLYSISRKFGVTVMDIRRWNNLTPNQKIYVDDQLKIILPHAVSRE